MDQNGTTPIANGARACLRKPFKLERLAEIVALAVGTGVHYIGEGGSQPVGPSFYNIQIR